MALEPERAKQRNDAHVVVDRVVAFFCVNQWLLDELVLGESRRAAAFELVRVHFRPVGWWQLHVRRAGGEGAPLTGPSLRTTVAPTPTRPAPQGGGAISKANSCVVLEEVLRPCLVTGGHSGWFL